ncbi:MAG: ammonium transporter, partial [Epsilonproteobacteria bacterium]
FAFTTSFVVMYVINKITPFRAANDEQLQGLDIEECGLEAYPEFKRSI